MEQPRHGRRAPLGPESREVLIFARAGRQLAAAARAAGYRALVADVFGDLDTLNLATCWAALPTRPGLCLDVAGLLTVLRHYCARAPHAAVVWGSGFEGRAALLAKMSQQRHLLGTGVAALRVLWDPAQLHQQLCALGIPTPALCGNRVPARGRWVVKRVGESGGGHVHWARTGTTLGRRRFAQAYVAGRSLSVALVAGAAEVAVLGFCEHLFWPSATQPFRYGGAIALRDLPPSVTQTISAVLARLCPALGLVGLCGIDFVLDARERCWLIEINSRPTATFDLLAHPGDVFRAHLAASNGQRLPAIRARQTLRAQAVYYTASAILIPDSLDWPVWIADRPQAGSTLQSGAPVCTVRASGATPEATQRCLQRRLDRLAELLGLPAGERPLPRTEPAPRRRPSR